MAVTAVSLTVAKANPPGKTLYHETAYSASWSGGEIVKAAPTSGAIYIERMVVCVGAAITLVLGDGTSDWTFVGTAEGTTYHLDFREPVRLAATTALTGTGSGAGACVVDVEGFVS
jgi:hypothetical protein